jgi:hypothetical protein
MRALRAIFQVNAPSHVVLLDPVGMGFAAPIVKVTAA